MDITTISQKGQIVIPAKLRKKYNLNRGDKLVIKYNNGKLILEPLPKKTLLNLKGKLKGPKSLVRELEYEHQKDFEKEK